LPISSIKIHTLKIFARGRKKNTPPG